MKKKRVLLVDGGGRGHALAWKLNQSPLLEKLFAAPGNAGTAMIAENVPLKATDIHGLLSFAVAQNIGVTIIGQDDPLALGIVDAFLAKGLRIFGPRQNAAEIESSKVFSKGLMRDIGVRTAPFVVIDNAQAASDHVREHFSQNAESIVVKARGLALGKGAYVCRTITDAQTAIDEIMVQRLYGSAGDEVVIESFVDEQEISIHAFCDGKSFKLWPSAQDHKPIFDGDNGLNTGGMGTIAPVPWFTDGELVSETIVRPVLARMQEIGRPFTGVLYPGLKMPREGPTVLEFNGRPGDPETQSYMRLLDSDLLEIFEACIDGRLHEVKVKWLPGFAVCIVLASAGYPSPSYRKGDVITGVEQAESLPGIVVFQAGTKTSEGQLITAGGRVLGVTAVGTTLRETLRRAYEAVARIHFEGMQFRTDIGAKSLDAS